VWIINTYTISDVTRAFGTALGVALLGAVLSAGYFPFRCSSRA
jgi:hypothetical protein